ncbi:uncharacterized protein BDV14DRAFT_167565 [Aspergillus stella-maris]|uniref:uncharacterized protein n=1 Tax=Aspergillus stella-maris TaxID=1810926 RepID=UPI003CCD6630
MGRGLGVWVPICFGLEGCVAGLRCEAMYLACAAAWSTFQDSLRAAHSSSASVEELSKELMSDSVSVSYIMDSRYSRAAMLRAPWISFHSSSSLFWLMSETGTSNSLQPHFSVTGVCNHAEVEHDDSVYSSLLVTGLSRTTDALVRSAASRAISAARRAFSEASADSTAATDAAAAYSSMRRSTSSWSKMPWTGISLQAMALTYWAAAIAAC